MSNNDKAAVDQLHSVYGRLKEEIGQVIVGQLPVIEQVLMAVFCRGHALLVGVPVGDHVIDFAAALARATRPKEKEAPDFVREMAAWGAGPHAGIGLIVAAKAHARFGNSPG